MKYPFYTLDVFTDTPLQGNPLAVVLDAETLDPDRMQALAREFNLSETVFVLPARDPVNTAALRIFTPGTELPFAGHPTVGTASLLAQVRAPEIVARQDLALVLEEGVGPVHCVARRHRGIMRARFTLPRLPAPAGDAGATDAIAAALGLASSDIGFDRHVPSVLSAGVPFTFVPVQGLDAAGRAWPDLGRWAAAFGPHGKVLVYTRDAVHPGVQVHARMFAPEEGIPEDPATGAAAAALAGVLMRFEPWDEGNHVLVIEQGIEMERASFITLGLDVDGGRLASASIGGHAVIVSQGTIEL